MIEPSFDHVVVAAPDVDDLVRSFRDRSGVDPTFGGSHVGRGTRNYLVGLGAKRYLELIGPDNPAASPLPTVFGIDQLTASRVAGWKVRATDIEATVAAAQSHGYDPGAVGPLSRQTPEGTILRWRLTQNPPTDYNGLIPGLIDWEDSPHPTSSNLPEIRLVTLHGHHAQPGLVRNALDGLGVELDVTKDDHWRSGLEMILDTPNGEMTLH